MMNRYDEDKRRRALTPGGALKNMAKSLVHSSFGLMTNVNPESPTLILDSFAAVSATLTDVKRTPINGRELEV
jgi:hypothetical protein